MLSLKKSVVSFYGKLKRKKGKTLHLSDGNIEHIPGYTLTHISTSYTVRRELLFGCTSSDGFVDLCCPSTQEFIRVHSIDTSIATIDFLIRLCREMDLNPSNYAIIIFRDKQKLNAIQQGSDSVVKFNPPDWTVPEPNSSISNWLELQSTVSNEPLQLPRLVSKEFVKAYMKPLLRAYPDSLLQAPSVSKPKSGKMLLNEFGIRIVIYLPRERKMVIRVHPEDLVSTVVAKVIVSQRLIPCHHRVQHPRTRTPLNLDESLASQDVTNGLEIQECELALSNLIDLKLEEICQIRARSSSAEPLVRNLNGIRISDMADSSQSCSWVNTVGVANSHLGVVTLPRVRISSPQTGQLSAKISAGRAALQPSGTTGRRVKRIAPGPPLTFSEATASVGSLECPSEVVLDRSSQPASNTDDCCDINGQAGLIKKYIGALPLPGDGNDFESEVYASTSRGSSKPRLLSVSSQGRKGVTMLTNREADPEAYRNISAESQQTPNGDSSMEIHVDSIITLETRRETTEPVGRQWKSEYFTLIGYKAPQEFAVPSPKIDIYVPPEPADQTVA